MTVFGTSMNTIRTGDAPGIARSLLHAMRAGPRAETWLRSRPHYYRDLLCNIRHVRTQSVDGLPGGTGERSANGDDAIAFDGHVAAEPRIAGPIDDPAALDQEVVGRFGGAGRQDQEETRQQGDREAR